MLSLGNFVRPQTFPEVGAEFELADNDLFKFFLNDDEVSKSSPDSSQSGPMSSPETEFDSPPSSPPSSPYLFGLKAEKAQNDTLTPTASADFWTVDIKEEPREHESPLLSPEDEDCDFSPSIDDPIDLDTKTQPFVLSREDLLKLSSKSLETYVQNLAASRPLTEEEERLLKRQRRLIKNRESAQLSRQRKRMYIEELEHKVSCLQSENNELMKQVSCLSSDNQTMKDEVFRLQNFIKQSPMLMSVPVGIQTGRKAIMTATTQTPTQSLGTSAIIPSGTTKFEKEKQIVEFSHQLEGGARKEVHSESVTDGSESATIQYLLAHPEELKKAIIQKEKLKIPSQGKKRKKGETEEIAKNQSETQTYILCPEVHEIRAIEKRITRTNKGGLGDKTTSCAPVISFLLPSSCVNNFFQSLQCKNKTTVSSAPLTLNNGDGGNSLIELSCQILETKAYSIGLSTKERVVGV